MSIPFIDLISQQLRIKDSVQDRLHKVLEHGAFIMGKEVAELENSLAEYVNVRHVISCSSGTDALLITLLAWGVGPGHAVFTTPFTFIATAEVISLLGATPVFVDIDPSTFNLDPAKLRQAVQGVLDSKDHDGPLPRQALEGKLTPKAIIPVDLYGLPYDADSIQAIADEFNLLVLEDAAQGFGGQYHGRMAGSLGNAGATSFFPAKPLGCYGDGGAVFTDDDALADILRSVRIHGKGVHKYENIRIGINGRLDTLQAAVLLAKMEIFPDEVERRQKVAAAYSELLAGIPDLTVPSVPQGCRSVYAQYTVEHPERDRLAAELKTADIPTMVYYPKPLHRQEAFSSLGYGHDDFPSTNRASDRVLSLPMHPYLDRPTQERIAEILRKTTA